MDIKQTALLADLHARIIEGEFGETDVLSLLALLREDAPRNGPVCELGHFVAHRCRDKGPIHRYMAGVRAILDRLGTQQDLLCINVVFSEADIARALDSALAAHRLKPLSTARHRQVQLAVLSMLQGVAMSDGQGHFGVLELTITREQIQLLGVVTLAKPPGVRVCFPVLTVGNDCYPMHSPHGSVRPPALLQVSVRGGVTVLEGIKPYAINIGRKPESGNPEPEPVTWAEVAAALAELPIMEIRAEAAEFDVPTADRSPVTFRLRDGRLSFPGRTEHFAPESPVWRCALALKRQLGARVFDDSGGYLFETTESLKALEPT